MWHMISRSAVLEDNLSRSSLPDLFVLHGWSPSLGIWAQERNCRHGFSLFHHLVLGEASKCSLWYDCIVLWDVVRQNVDRCQLRRSESFRQLAATLTALSTMSLWRMHAEQSPIFAEYLLLAEEAADDSSDGQHGQSLAQFWNVRNEGLRWPEHGSIWVWINTY